MDWKPGKQTCSRAAGLCLLLVACVDFTKDGNDNESSPDSGSVSDTGSSADSEGRDTSENEPTGPIATVRPEGDAEGMLVGVRQMVFGDEDLGTGDLLSAAPVSGGQANVALNEPDSDELEADESGTLYGTFIITLHDDENGNGQLDDDEPIEGLSQTILLYLPASPSPESNYAGLPAGWSALVTLVPEDEESYVGDLDAISIEPNLQTKEDLIIGGSYESDSETSGSTRLAAIPTEVEDYTPDVLTHLIFDVALNESWEASVSGAPHPSHASTNEESPITAVELPIAYLDVDSSESLSLAVDETMHGVCYDALPVVLFWIDPIVDPAFAVIALFSEIQPGWSAWTHQAGEITVLTSDQALNLEADPSCSLE